MSTRRPAISYIRFSSGRQAKGASLDRQTDQAQRWCEAKGLVLSDELHDLGVSAYTGKNTKQGALSRLLALVEDGKVERGTYLLVESIDRISRREPLEALPLLLDLIRKGITIVTLGDGVEYDRESLNSGRAFMLLAIVQRAHEESATKSKRLTDVWSRKRKRAASEGKPIGGRCPAWLRVAEDGSQYEVVAEAAAIVRRIFEMSAAGSGVRSITKTLNSEGVKPIGRGDSWHESYIRKILFNRAVLGEYQPHVKRDGRRVPHGHPIEDFYPPVVSKTLWHRSHRAIADRQKRPPGRRGKWAGLLSGLLRDSLGSPWVHLNKHKRQLVSDKGRRGVKGHPYRSVPAIEFEQAVLLVLRMTWAPVVADAGEDKTAEAEADLADLKSRLQAVREGIMSGDASTVKTLVAMVPDLEGRQAELEHEVERLRAEVHGGGNLLPSLATRFFDNPDDNSVRLALRQSMRERVDAVVIGHTEKVSCEPMKDQRTGRWVKQHAGQWVDVEVQYLDGGRCHAQLFMPLRDGLPAVRFAADDQHDLGGWEALATTGRVSYRGGPDGATFTIHPEPLPPSSPVTIATAFEIDDKVWVQVDMPADDESKVDAALATDGLRRGRERVRIADEMYADRVLGRRGETIKLERVLDALRSGDQLIVQDGWMELPT